MDITCKHWCQSDNRPCGHYLKGGLCSRPDMFRCIEYVKTHEISLSHSSVKDFTVCKRKFYHSYIQGLEPVEKNHAMKMGSCVSEVLDYCHGGPDIAPMMVKWYNTVDTYFPPKEEVYPQANLSIKGILMAYIERFSMRGKTQFEFNWKEFEYPNIHGYLDYVHPDLTWAYEFKYSSRPDTYGKFSLQDQLGIYFLGLPSLQRMTVRVIQVPQLRLGRAEKSADFIERVYNDVKSRPNHYFQEESYYRSEFPLEPIKAKSRRIALEIGKMMDGNIDDFYQNNSPGSCFFPGPCQFISICESGVISETLYQKRNKK